MNLRSVSPEENSMSQFVEVASPVQMNILDNIVSEPTNIDKLELRMLQRKWRLEAYPDLCVKPPMYRSPNHADSDDSIRLYLQDISEFPLLTKMGEQELMMLIHTGSPTEVYWAKKTFIQSNLRLVVSVAKRFPEVGNLSFLDYIQVGNDGLRHALTKFDINTGFKFSTYATWWIYQRIQRYIAENSSVIRVPGYVSDLLRSTELTFQKKEISENASVLDIAAATGLTEQLIEKYFYFKKLTSTVSTNKTVGDGDMEFGDMLADQNDAYTEVDNEYQMNIFNILAKTMDPDQYQLLNMRYSGENMRTLQEIGSDYGITREAIRIKLIRAMNAARIILRAHGLE